MTQDTVLIIVGIDIESLSIYLTRHSNSSNRNNIMSELINNKDNTTMEIDSDDEDVIGLKGGVEDNTTNEPEEDTSLNNPDVVTKYQEAAKIVQSALVEIIAKCVPGNKIVDICRFGDELIEAKTKAIYKNKNKAGK